jgi:hypothetical protein
MYTTISSTGIRMFIIIVIIPRSMAARVTFENTEAEGELYRPFDLARHDYETMCRLIVCDFKEYLNTTRSYK